MEGSRSTSPLYFRFWIITYFGSADIELDTTHTDVEMHARNRSSAKNIMSKTLHEHDKKKFLMVAHSLVR